MIYQLITRDNDIWEYDKLEDARRDLYIFGGKIIKLEIKKEMGVK